MDINEHPICKAIYELCLEIEKLPASEQQTKVICMTGELQGPLSKLIQELREANKARDSWIERANDAAGAANRFRTELIRLIIKIEDFSQQHPSPDLAAIVNDIPKPGEIWDAWAKPVKQ